MTSCKFSQLGSEKWILNREPSGKKGDLHWEGPITQSYPVTQQSLVHRSAVQTGPKIEGGKLTPADG